MNSYNLSPLSLLCLPGTHLNIRQMKFIPPSAWVILRPASLYILFFGVLEKLWKSSLNMLKIISRFIFLIQGKKLALLVRIYICKILYIYVKYYIYVQSKCKPIYFILFYFYSVKTKFTNDIRYNFTKILDTALLLHSLFHFFHFFSFFKITFSI